ncbi:WD40-repeat-containing domain protein [Piptocephalis cylindrospora]|uniref:Peroxin-7 n=1 Tax=Piptocephalis cylindrospora TaxID=1907219 RepID=A0A4P9Y196_9FUNG|nr:WD40-repeat-containing domain protein [Piptocephalis cylindrospora]|eukprot:RKP12548.1 WD40-repeat-containing domain protein [Piptocephalis cylindrospora]
MAQTFHTRGFKGYGVQFSPFHPDRLAVATAANFGLVGNGKLWILRQGPQGIAQEHVYDTQDGLFDLAWNELNEHQLVTASGDGSIKLWDLTLPDYPIRQWSEHTKEVFSVSWDLIGKHEFLSSSWDGTVKLWNPERPDSISTFAEHSGCVYEAIFSPKDPGTFASCSGDRSVRIWSVQSPQSTMTLPIHPDEVLTLDWDKYRPTTLVTGCVDRAVRVFDLRQPSIPLHTLPGHSFAIRRVRCSPWEEGVFGSVGYDMSLRVWRGDREVGRYDGHTEFVVGMDWSLGIQGQIATCAWDESVHLYDAFSPPPPPGPHPM